MDPATSEDWQQVGTDRLGDARAILSNNAASAGAAYLSGYGVECSLKSLIALSGQRIPKGAGGHDLINLTKLAGIQLGSIKTGTWFLERWAVDWRYLQQSSQLPLSYSPEDCVDAAGRLQGYIRKRLMRQARHAIRRQRR